MRDAFLTNPSRPAETMARMWYGKANVLEPGSS